MNRAVATNYLRSLVLPPSGQFDVDELPVAKREAVFRLFASAEARLDAALQLQEAGKDASALSLFREALHACSRVLSTAKDEQSLAGDDLDSIFDRLSNQLGQEHERLLSKLRDQLSLDDRAEYDSLPPDALRRRTKALSRATGELLDIVRPRSRSTIRLVDYAPFASFMTTVVLLLGTTFYFMLQPTNIARGRPVTASGVAFETRPEGAVDGRTFGDFGFHSANDPSPWLQIDLESDYRISEVRVWGRHDCCYDQSIPLVCEVSTDGKHFSSIGTRKERFEQVDPWVLEPNGATARYLRVRSVNPTVLVLSEVEVFGKRVR